MSLPSARVAGTLVICTTGFSPEQKARMQAASAQTAILNSANMSLGVNLLLSLVKQAAALLSDTFDIEIVEKHHNQKVDAPSGTALMIADAINEALEGQKEYVFGRHSKTERRKKQDIGIHAVRGGAIVGEHSVIFAYQGEVVEVNHTALSRMFSRTYCRAVIPCRTEIRPVQYEGRHRKSVGCRTVLRSPARPINIKYAFVPSQMEAA